MKLVRWDPFQELVPVSHGPNRTGDHSYSNRIEDSFGPWAVDIFARQDHLVETAKAKVIEIEPA